MNFSASIDYYGDGRYLQREFTHRFINKLTFGAQDAVLDVGCGTGEETKEIAKLVKNITGVDASKKMIAIAEENKASNNVTYCTWDARTVGDNPEWRERFDKVVSFFVLHWFPEHTEAFASMLACLKPGGEALIILTHRGSIPPRAHLFLNNHTKWAEYLQGFKQALCPWKRSCQETEDLLRASGWTDVECEVQLVTTSDELQTKLFLKTVLGQTERIPEAMQEEYLEDLWQWALSRWGEKSQPGYVRLQIEPMIIHARKPAGVDEDSPTC